MPNFEQIFKIYIYFPYNHIHKHNIIVNNQIIKIIMSNHKYKTQSEMLLKSKKEILKLIKNCCTIILLLS